MKHRLLWAIVILLIFTDAGMTYWAVTGGHGEEQNPNVVEWIESHGLGVAIAISVSIRLVAVGVGIVAQELCPYPYIDSLPLLAVLPISALPVAWNTLVLLP